MGYWDQTNSELTGCKDHKIIKAPVLFQWVWGTYKSHFTLELNNIELLLIIINGNYKDFFMTQKEDQCLADIMVIYSSRINCSHSRFFLTFLLSVKYI